MKNIKQNPAGISGGQARLLCFVCKKEIVDSGWFCRVPQRAHGGAAPEEAKILLCSPFCALRYFGDSQPGGNGFEPAYDGYERSRQVAPGQKPAKAENGRAEQ